MYDFDKAVDRRNTNSLKYDFAVERGYPEDVLPLWVADMDFPAPAPVLEALQKAISHGIFGYSEVKGDYYKAVSAWFSKQFGYTYQEEWLVKTPGVVYSLATAVRSLTKPGDNILITPPVYYPFYSVVKDNNRCLVESELIYQNGRYEIDFNDMEQKIRQNEVKLFILCSPHNPIGRVWTVDELQRIGKICAENQVIVISDEIHCDFAFSHPHTIFLQACPELKDSAIVCTAPSKSFNLAGLQVSNIWIPSQELRRRFINEMDKTGYSQLNSLGLVGAQAAYEQGEQWLTECKEYIGENLNFLRSFLEEKLPEISLVEPEGTYFSWLDCSRLGLDRETLNDLVIQKARLWLDAGHIFGKNSEQFQRVVLACQRSTLKRALEQLERAVHEYFI